MPNPSHPLENCVALVTGAQQGIGAAIARAMAEAGANVAINWLDDRPAAEALAHDIRAMGHQAHLVHGSVAEPATAARLVDDTVQALGRIDILVANAGMFPRVTMLDMTEADWDFVMNINLKGTFFCAQAAARAMIAAGTPGNIITLGSRSMRGTLRGVHYSASKGGISSMTRAMALELAPHDIRVNCIAPGLTDTAQPRYGNTDAELAEMAKDIPLRRMAQASEIAAGAVFLASDAASYMTGQLLHLNGGSYMP